MAPTRTTQGFTLIELLIAVLIIGILAAIALPAFNKQRERAKDSAAQQSLEAGLRAAKAVYAEGESFPSSGLGALLGRAERSQSFAEASIFPASAGIINVQRASASRVILRSLSTSGNQHMLALDEPDSRVTRYGPQPDSASATIPTITNMVTNPSFETNTTVGGVIGGGTTSLTRSTDWSASGRYSLLYSGTNTGGSAVGMGVYQPGWSTASVPVAAGEVWSASARVRMVNNAGSAARIYFRIFDSGGAGSIPSQLGPLRTIANGDETTLTLTATMPAGAAYFTVPVIVNSVPASGSTSFYIDALTITRTSRPAGFFDGDSPAAAWAGTAHASTSTGPLGYPTWNAG